MDNTSLTSDFRKRAIERIMARREELQRTYDAVMREPASYGISGSVNATNQRLADLRTEMASCDRQLRAVLGGGFPLTISLPDYKHDRLR